MGNAIGSPTVKCFRFVCENLITFPVGKHIVGKLDSWAFWWCIRFQHQRRGLWKIRKKETLILHELECYQQASCPCCDNSACRGCHMHTVFPLMEADGLTAFFYYKPGASITRNTVFMNGRQWRTAHGSNWVSATHAATRRYAHAKIRYISVRTYPSQIQYIRYISSSLDGSPPPRRRAATRPCSQITLGRFLKKLTCTSV